MDGASRDRYPATTELRMQRSSRPYLARVIMAIAAVGLFLIGYQWGNQYQHARTPLAKLEGVLLRPPVALPELELHGPRGPFSDTDLQGRWSLMAFGSPGSALGHRAVARLIEVANRLAAEPKLRSELQLLLISADDVPSLARDFEQLTPSLRILSTTEQQLAALKQTIGAGPTAAPEAAQQPPPLFLIGPSARLVALFSGGQSASSIAADLTSLSERPQQLMGTPMPSIGPNPATGDNANRASSNEHPDALTSDH